MTQIKIDNGEVDDNNCDFSKNFIKELLKDQYNIDMLGKLDNK